MLFNTGAVADGRPSGSGVREVNGTRAGGRALGRAHVLQAPT